MFNTSLEKIFGVKKYADALTKIVKKRDIKLNFKRNLISINPEKKEAVFEVPDDTDSEKKLLETYQVGVFTKAIFNTNLPFWMAWSLITF